MADTNQGHLYEKNKPRITHAAAYVRCKLDYLYERGLHKTRSARINGSRSASLQSRKQAAIPLIRVDLRHT